MDYSIVEYFSDHEVYKCGYCKKQNTAHSRAMWAHSLTVEDYESLLIRGWRRSGKYCYKPTMKKTCCPQYEIRCDVTQIKLSKSQKKVMRKMKKYLLHGDGETAQKTGEGTQSNCDAATSEPEKKENSSQSVVSGMKKDGVPAAVSLENSIDEDSSGRRTPSKVYLEDIFSHLGRDIFSQLGRKFGATSDVHAIVAASDVHAIVAYLARQFGAVSDLQAIVSPLGRKFGAANSSSKRIISRRRKTNVTPGSDVTRGLGADPKRPQCVKAKVRRSEKKKAKMAENGAAARISNTSASSNTRQPLTWEEDLPHLKPAEEGARHKLEVRLVQLNPMSIHFEGSQDESYNLYKKYQMAVHNDSEDECNRRHWKRVLVDSPLQAERDGNGVSYGSFHNQYWLDGRLIAVGVVDILPTFVSSVYVYYDIEFCSLSLGVYTALSEIALTRSYHALKSEMRYYCLGHFVETCSKMTYKAAYSPSFLLCPETYQWVNLEKCRETLQKFRYARLNVLDGGSPEDICEDSFTEPMQYIELSRVLVLYKERMGDYLTYRTQKAVDNHIDGDEDTLSTRDELDEIRQYAALVGRTCAYRMLLYRT